MVEKENIRASSPGVLDFVLFPSYVDLHVAGGVFEYSGCVPVREPAPIGGFRAEVHFLNFLPHFYHLTT